MFGATLKATNSSFQKDMTFCRSIYVKKVMKLLAFIFEQPSYTFLVYNDVLSQTANLDILGVQAGWPEYRLVKKRLELATGWAEPRSSTNI